MGCVELEKVPDPIVATTSNGRSPRKVGGHPEVRSQIISVPQLHGGQTEDALGVQIGEGIIAIKWKAVKGRQSASGELLLIDHTALHHFKKLRNPSCPWTFRSPINQPSINSVPLDHSGALRHFAIGFPNG